MAVGSLVLVVDLHRIASLSDSYPTYKGTDENARKSEISFDFLPIGKKIEAIIYEDAKDAHRQKNPIAYKIRTIEVTSKSKINWF